MTFEELQQIVPSKVRDSDCLVIVPIDFTVDEYPPVPRPTATFGTEDEWRDFWILRDAFLHGHVFVSERIMNKEKR